jgi:hypothetical protein
LRALPRLLGESDFVSLHAGERRIDRRGLICRLGLKLD